MSIKILATFLLLAFCLIIHTNAQFCQDFPSMQGPGNKNSSLLL